MEIPTFFFVARLIVLASGLLLGASFVSGRLVRFLPPAAFAILLVLIAGEPTVFSWWQYQAWAADPRSQLLLPPTAPISYFLRYVFLHFWVWRILGGLIALAFFLLADRFVIRPSQGFRMNRREAALIAFGMMLSGWPYLLVYFSALLLFYVGILSFFTLRRFTARRVAAPREKYAELSGHGIPPQRDERGEALSERHSPGGASGLSNGPASGEEARFPVALPATLALLIIPWAHDIIVALGLTVLRVTVLSV
ncbi:MAG: hypothetical protein HY475_01545 [Candidatus Terrybacteria bacterium]|nr:hypothetical protein [Candidatus Terrybacteria bacterium]